MLHYSQSVNKNIALRVCTSSEKYIQKTKADNRTPVQARVVIKIKTTKKEKQQMA